MFDYLFVEDSLRSILSSLARFMFQVRYEMLEATQHVRAPKDPPKPLSQRKTLSEHVVQPDTAKKNLCKPFSKAFYFHGSRFRRA